MMLEGIIQEDATVLGEDGKVYHFGSIEDDGDGSFKALFDATDVGGGGYFGRQSIKPYVGMRVVFRCNTFAPHGFNYKILKEKEVKNERISCNNNK